MHVCNADILIENDADADYYSRYHPAAEQHKGRSQREKIILWEKFPEYENFE